MPEALCPNYPNSVGGVFVNEKYDLFSSFVNDKSDFVFN